MNSKDNENQPDEPSNEELHDEAPPLLSQIFPALMVPRGLGTAELTLGKERLQASIIEFKGLRWINIEQPGNAEITWLEQKFKINHLHLEDFTSYFQRPKLDDFEDYLFIVLHFPFQQKAERTLVPCEIDFVLGVDYVITVHDGRLPPLKKLFEACRADPKRCKGIMGRSAAFLLYSIIDVLVDYCFPIINSYSEKLELIDEEIFKSSSKKTVYYISTLRREIIAFRRIIKPQIAIMANLGRRRHINEGENLEGYFSDLSDHISKIWDSLEEFKDIIEGLSATYDSLTSHRLNQIIKTLTIISVVLMPMTLVSSIYGMNVPLPFQEHSPAFWVLMVVMLITGIGLILFFRSRKWL